MTVDLEELVICAPGLSVAQAREVAEAVARRLGEALAEKDFASCAIGALDLRVALAPGTSTERIVDSITGAVLARLV